MPHTKGQPLSERPIRQPLSFLDRKIQIFLGKEACNPAQEIINIYKFRLKIAWY